MATGLVSTAPGADDCGRTALGRGETNMEMSNVDYPPSYETSLHAIYIGILIVQRCSECGGGEAVREERWKEAEDSCQSCPVNMA